MDRVAQVGGVEGRASWDGRIVRRWISGLLLLAIPSILIFRNVRAIDSDLWWHWATGRWILAHHALPLADPFSSYRDGVWVAYSWLFDIAMYGLQTTLGVASAPAFVAVVATLAIGALYALCRQARASHETAVALALLALVALLPFDTPRPWLPSILFYVVTLILIERDRQAGRVKAMWLLPAVFLLWTNIHVEFVYGFVALAALLAECGTARWRKQPALPGRAVLACASACALATLINPYFTGLYRVIADLSLHRGQFSFIQEMQPLAYHKASDWVFLLFALGATATLARQRLDLFRSLLFAASIVIAFPSGRQLWVLIPAACLAIAGYLPARDEAVRVPRPGLALGFVLLAAWIGVGVHRVDERRIDALNRDLYPVEEVEYLQGPGSRLEGALFNDYGQGGYLVWALPQRRVSVDGRAEVYGAKWLRDQLKAIQLGEGWRQVEAFDTARLVLLPPDEALAVRLLDDPGYAVIHRSKAAILFQRRAVSSAP
jgi:hypothetical protein